VPRVDALERPASRCRQSGEDEVFLDVQAAENAPLFVHELHAGLGDRVALLPGDFGAVEQNGAGARLNDAHQALQGRGLAGAVAAKQRHHFVTLDGQRDVEEDVGIPIIGIESVDLKQAHAACTPPR